MINVSFYLLTPDALSQSQVYVSISKKRERVRFATGETFITNYCNVRKKKGTKDLVKKNTPFYFEYSSKLNQIRDSLIHIEIDLSKKGNYTLEEIRDSYDLKVGKIKDETDISYIEAFNKFVAANQNQWSDGTRRHFISVKNHLIEYEKLTGKIILNDFNEELWNKLRDDYFVKNKTFSNSSTNKNLTRLKQFLKFASKKHFIKHKIDWEELKFLEEIEAFKIALKEYEVELLMRLDLSDFPRLDKVRDLFALEILTGQRFSDIPKLLDSKHISDTNIQIYQQKTGEKVTIPLHPKLKDHLANIANKYPEKLPTISNQKFNVYLKEICKIAGFDREHSWTVLSGKRKITKIDFRYNLITSHTGRRTFCTLALNRGINSELIMKVTGHRKYDQFREYVKVDDADLDKAFDSMFSDKN